MTPEERARLNIDRMLEDSGWCIQDYADRDIDAAVGVAIREYLLEEQQSADYLLFINGRAVGIVEAKREGATLSGALQQAERYRNSLPADLPHLQTFPFAYATTGVETYFLDLRDPTPRSRPVFTFHTPETLRRAVLEARTLRTRLAGDLPPLGTGSLRACQFEAIRALEDSLKSARPRALIQMATGSGKTHAAVTSVYRLIRHAQVRRVLFLVDRRNLGRQTLREFQAYTVAEDGRKFHELYNVQLLASNAIDEGVSVCITTLQRLYAMLKGDHTYETADEETSAFEEETEHVPEVVYNPAFPIDTFDVIIVDECHRSIYGKWRQVLEYFDAFIIGLTATPYSQTLGFFEHNLVYEYRHAQAVADNVNVGYYVYNINTEITQHGGQVEAGHYVARRDKQTRQLRWDELDADVEYAETELDRNVVAVDQIRTVIETFKEKLFTELFPYREIVPKTLIFAKDDSHAEDIVQIVRDVFGKGDAFCQKITYQSDRPEEKIRQFRTDPIFRIAVSVDMISTGTDIRPLECLLFMRAVRSTGYLEQMIGRGVRIIDPNDLRSVTGDATEKTHFILVDTVGVWESVITDSDVLPGDPPSDETERPTAEREGGQLMDSVSEDRVLSTGFDGMRSAQATDVIALFKDFISKHVDEFRALQILCSRTEEQISLTLSDMKTLADVLRESHFGLTPESLWFAYQQRFQQSVLGDVERQTDLISLVRYVIGVEGILEPFRVSVNRRFYGWMRDRTFTNEQRHWLEMIRDHIITSVDIGIEDFEYAPFAELGNGMKAYQLFGEDLEALLNELTQVLVG